jgi:hypothetical protein
LEHKEFGLHCDNLALLAVAQIQGHRPSN